MIDNNKLVLIKVLLNFGLNNSANFNLRLNYNILI